MRTKQVKLVRVLFRQLAILTSRLAKARPAPVSLPREPVLSLRGPKLVQLRAYARRHSFLRPVQRDGVIPNRRDFYLSYIRKA